MASPEESTELNPKLTPFEEGGERQERMVRMVASAIAELAGTSATRASELNERIAAHEELIRAEVGHDADQIHLLHVIKGSTSPKGILYWDIPGPLSVHQFAIQIYSQTQ